VTLFSVASESWKGDGTDYFCRCTVDNKTVQACWENTVTGGEVEVEIEIVQTTTRPTLRPSFYYVSADDGALKGDDKDEGFEDGVLTWRKTSTRWHTIQTWKLLFFFSLVFVAYQMRRQDDHIMMLPKNDGNFTHNLELS
jgi:hypothetical protein